MSKIGLDCLFLWRVADDWTWYEQSSGLLLLIDFIPLDL